MHHQRIAVGRRLRDNGRADGPASTGSIVDNDRLTPQLGSFWPKVRARMSVALPAVNGTMTCTGLLGYDWPAACPAACSTARSGHNIAIPKAVKQRANFMLGSINFVVPAKAGTQRRL